MLPGKCQFRRSAFTKGATCTIGIVSLLHNLTSKVPNGQSQYFGEPIQSPSNPQNSNMMESKRKMGLWEIYTVFCYHKLGCITRKASPTISTVDEISDDQFWDEEVKICCTFHHFKESAARAWVTNLEEKLFSITTDRRFSRFSSRSIRGGWRRVNPEFRANQIANSAVKQGKCATSWKVH